MFSLAKLTFIIIAHEVILSEQTKYMLNNVTNFIAITESPIYVDTSLFMKYIFDGSRNKVITAPRSFLKSTNMDMLRIFLAFPENISLANRLVNVEEARKKFSCLEIYKKKEEFFEHYFAKFPVLHIDFKVAETANITDTDKAMEVIRDKVHECFKLHKDLCLSERLIRSERILCTLYSDDEDYLDLWPSDYTKAIIRLCKFLYKHHEGRKVFVIVDDFDSVINSALFNTNRDDLDNITSTFKEMFTYVLQDKKYTERVILTGRSAIAGGFLAETNEVRFYTFLGDHDFAEYFGFEVNKLDNALTKCNLEEDLIDKMRDKFYAYISRREVFLYSPVSILSSLHFGFVKNFWTKEWYIEGLREIFKVYSVRENLRMVIRRLLDDECVDIPLVLSTSRNILFGLQSLFDGRLDAKPTDIQSLFFSYLFEQGYLCFGKEGRSCFKIPNKELHREFFVISGIQHYQIH